MNQIVKGSEPLVPNVTAEEEEAWSAHWTTQTQNLPEETAPVPLNVLFTEAVALADLLDRLAQPTQEKDLLRPGLDLAIRSGRLPANTAKELRELQVVTAYVQRKAGLSLEKYDSAAAERGNALISEFRAALAYLLEDGNHEDGERLLARLRTDHSRITTLSALAMALDGYAELASRNTADLELLGFETSRIEEAFGVARQLRKRSANRQTGEMVQEQRQLIALRKRLVGALTERMRIARRAIRYVFRDFPDIVALSQSAHERRRRGRATEVEEVVDLDAGDETGDEAAAVEEEG